MTTYVIDRNRMPQPWDRPLVFHARGDGAFFEVEVEVEDAAAVEYRATAYFRRNTILGQDLVEDTRETFVVLVEAALNATIADDTLPPRRRTVTFGDLAFD